MWCNNSPSLEIVRCYEEIMKMKTSAKSKAEKEEQLDSEISLKYQNQ